MLGYGHPWQNSATIDDVRRALPVHAPWYNWRHDAEHINDNYYTPMAWHLKPGRYFDGAVATAKTTPQRLWYCGNEPDNPAQANMAPTAFVDGLQRFQGMSGVPVAAPGVLINKTGFDSDAWLTTFSRLYSSHHAWHVHVYGFSTPDEWEQYWLWWKQTWWRQWGQGKPVIVTETAGRHPELLPFLAELVRRDDVLVGVYWFATWYSEGDTWLVTETAKRTALGDAFVDAVGIVEGQASYTAWLPMVSG